MALDVRRYQQARDRDPGSAMKISGSTFPGLVTLAIGVFIIVVGIILLAAFGVPKDVATNPKPISGVVVLGAGLLVCGIGVCVALYLKKKNDALKRERKRAEQQQQNQRHQEAFQQQYERPQQLHVPADNSHQAAAPTSNQLYDNHSYNHGNSHAQAQYHKQYPRASNGAVATVYS